MRLLSQMDAIKKRLHNSYQLKIFIFIVLFFRCSLTRQFEKWRLELFHQDWDAKFLLTGLAEGFRLVTDITLVTSAFCEKYRSALGPKVKRLLDELINEELKMGRF